eukprot:6065800-Pleurochrysis_carterae.AAC.1
MSLFGVSSLLGVSPFVGLSPFVGVLRSGMDSSKQIIHRVLTSEDPISALEARTSADFAQSSGGASLPPLTLNAECAVPAFCRASLAQLVQGQPPRQALHRLADLITQARTG